MMSYKDLRKITKGTGLEVHHLIEKRFADILGIKADDIISAAIDSKLHDEITSAMRKEIGYSYEVWKKLTTSNATKEDVWRATKKVYEEKGLQQYLEPVKEMFRKAGVDVGD